MTATIEPEPTDVERRAILAALGREQRDDGHPVYKSAWRRAALHEASAADADPEAHDARGDGAPA